jgi:hypothetical protein
VLLLLLMLLLMMTIIMLRSVTIRGLHGPAARRPGPARTARDIVVTLNFASMNFTG